MSGLLLAVLLAGWAPAPAAELEGTRWRMRLRAEGSWLPFWKGDELEFAAGRFASRDAGPYGFPPSRYEERADGEVLLWRSTQTSNSGETTVWTGARRGRRMTGLVEWIQEDGRARRYVFTAEQRPPSAGGEALAGAREEGARVGPAELDGGGDPIGRELEHPELEPPRRD